MPRDAGRITVKIDTRQMDSLLDELKGMPKQMSKAKVSAVKKTLKTAESKMSSAIRVHANLKKNVVDENIRVVGRPTEAKPSGKLIVRGYKIPLWLYGGSKSDLNNFADQKGVPVRKRKPRGGAGWKVRKGGKRVRNNRFVATFTTKSRQATIIQRMPGSRRGGKYGKAPKDYRTAYGPSLTWFIERENILGPTTDEISKTLEKNLRSQVDRFLKRKKTARG